MALSVSFPMTVTQTFRHHRWAYNKQELKEIYYVQKTKNHSWLLTHLLSRIFDMLLFMLRGKSE